METKEVKIEIPEGYEIDKKKSTFEKIIFKKKDTKPKSWEEYCANTQRKSHVWITGYSKVETILNNSEDPLHEKCDKGTLPSKELAEKFIAYMQLMTLYKAWVKDWDKPLGYCIRCHIDNTLLITHGFETTPLRFPTREMAVEFRNCFRNILDEAKGLY